MSFLKKLMPGHKNKNGEEEVVAHDASMAAGAAGYPAGAAGYPAGAAGYPAGYQQGAVGVAGMAPAAVAVAPSSVGLASVDVAVHTAAPVVAVAPVAVAVQQPVAATKEEVMVLSEEKLVVSKSAAEVGGVDIEKRIEVTTAQVPVTLEREVVSVERRPISGAAMSGNLATFGQAEAIVATVHADQAVAAKTIVPTEQLVFNKERIAEQQMVQGTVRSENVDVKENMGAEVGGVRWAAGAAAGASAGGAAGAAQSGNIMGADGRVVAYEEQLAVGKERVAVGQVQVQKRIDTAVASAPVTLEREVLNVQRLAPDAGIGMAAPTSLTEGRVRIGLQSETAQVGTVVAAREEVVIRKGVQVEQQMVSAELARERITVGTDGSVAPAGAATTATTTTTTTTEVPVVVATGVAVGQVGQVGVGQVGVGQVGTGGQIATSAAYTR